ncbi:MAG: DNA helicase RecQ [Sporomusaceae bacterium]|nr:DNA helicase RecQ [Sporomusaceae bacterium]
MLNSALKILQQHYGYTTFRPGQDQIITSLLQYKDTLAIMPTGAGKSLCFQIPALLLPGVTLVVSPLISLMKDQVDALGSLGIPATFINSSLTMVQVNERIYKARCGHYKIIYIAPERLESETFQSAIKPLTISLLAIDEAHCVSQWGHDFRPSYRGIGAFICSLPTRPIIAAFTATATTDVTKDIVALLALKKPDIYITGFDRENLLFTVVRGENRQDFTLKYIDANKSQSGIIYAATRKEVDNLYTLLQKKGYSVGKYHAGLTDKERQRYQEAFIYDDISIIVATNAFGMGIDKSNVRYVIHYNMPKSMEAYYQEAGRAGRDGEKSECILLFGAQDPLLQRFLIEQTTGDFERKAHELNKLQTMVDYCHTPECLRKFILNYFGETKTQAECDNCSNCNDDNELTDITLDAQKIFSCVMRMKERYGTTLVASVLKGSKDKKVLHLGFDSLSTYGLLKTYTLQEIRDSINRLIATDYLTLTDSEYPVVKLAGKATAVLKGQAKVWQKVPRRPQKLAADNSLFEVLRALRKEIADREKVPPYHVFADSTLKEMSEYYPTDHKGLLAIKGVGEVKLARYGQEFLRLLQEYVSKNNLKSSSPSPEAEQAADKNQESPSHIITLQMYQAGRSLEQISQERKLKELTVQDHLVRCSTEGHAVNWNPLIPPQYEQLILRKIGELGASKLKTIKDALPDEVEYTAIKAVLCKYSCGQ